MNRVFVTALLLATALAPARAEMSPDAARAAVVPFYKALNAEFANDSAALIRQATATDWVSCRGNDVCNSRDEVIAGVAQRLKSVPDLKWGIKDVLVSANQVTVRGEATGTPAGEFMRISISASQFSAPPSSPSPAAKQCTPIWGISDGYRSGWHGSASHCLAWCSTTSDRRRY